jgi:TorA maturation chaperone TorD
MYGWLGPLAYYKEQGACLQQIAVAIGNEFEDSQNEWIED